MKEQLIERLTRYVQVNTQSDASSDTTPSTPGQWDLLHMLEEEMKTLGLEEITLDENGYLFGTVPATVEGDYPTIGLLAHVDTATDYTGENVNPQRIDNYDGKDLLLGGNVPMTVKDFPELQNYVGHTLITTDGTTLLGADNKAGIAEILTAVEYLMNNKDIPHGKLRIGFTPDEEIGRGPAKFDVDAFGADFAYTIDGGPIGELQYESFNAASATVTFHGKNIHPGSAKDKMINSLLIAHEFQAMMPEDAVPEKTEGYEGFIYLMEMHGETEKTTLDYIIRDHSREKFEEKKAFMQRAAEKIAARYGEQAIDIQIEDSYYNMREKIEPVISIVTTVKEVYEDLGIEPIIEPIRGGTDGSQLSFMGLPTPNIFTGGENFHGRYEFISADDMVKASTVIVEMVQRFVK